MKLLENYSRMIVDTHSEKDVQDFLMNTRC
jgi:hypothetical protein